MPFDRGRLSALLAREAEAFAAARPRSRALFERAGGALPGHGPPAVLEAVAAQAARGITTMLPTEDAIWVGEELSRRFGLARWVFTLTATDANRTALRLARQLTGRPFVVVYSYCYHGSVDEAFAVEGDDGATHAREGNVGPPVDPALTTRAIEFNDLEALEDVLSDGLVACVLAEPAMTNKIGRA